MLKTKTGLQQAVIAIALGSWLISPAVLAEGESPKEDAKKAGRAVGSAFREIGQGAKKAGKEVGSAAREGGREFRKAVKGESSK